MNLNSYIGEEFELLAQFLHSHAKTWVQSGSVRHFVRCLKDQHYSREPWVFCSPEYHFEIETDSLQLIGNTLC